MIKLKSLLSEATTIHQINKLAKKYGIKLVAGKGYYYWVGLNNKTKNILGRLDSTSVMVYRVSQAPLDFWKSEIQDIVKRGKL